MYRVAAQTGDGGAVGKAVINQFPGTRCIDRFDDFTDRSIEMHSVAAQAVVHQPAFSVVRRIGEDSIVFDAVRSGVSLRELLLMAGSALFSHRIHVRGAEEYSFGRLTRQVRTQAAQVIGRRAFVAGGAIHIAM